MATKQQTSVVSSGVYLIAKALCGASITILVQRESRNAVVLALRACTLAVRGITIILQRESRNAVVLALRACTLAVRGITIIVLRASCTSPGIAPRRHPLPRRRGLLLVGGAVRYGAFGSFTQGRVRSFISAIDSFPEKDKSATVEHSIFGRLSARCFQENTFFFFFFIITFTSLPYSSEVLPSAIFWTSRGHRCRPFRPFTPPVRAFIFCRA